MYSEAWTSASGLFFLETALVLEQAAGPWARRLARVSRVSRPLTDHLLRVGPQRLSPAPGPRPRRCCFARLRFATARGCHAELTLWPLASARGWPQALCDTS